MKKFFSIALSVGIFSLGGLRAQPSPEPSGIYQNLTLGIDPGQGVVTGLYQEIIEPPNLPRLECSFYLFGKKQGAHYAIQVWSPGDKKPHVTAGTLSFYSADNKNPSVLLRLESLDRDCTAIKPNLAKGQGVFFDLKKGGAWMEVRMVAQKSPYFQAPDPSSPTRDSAKRGTVLTVMERRQDWAQVESEQKPKGWIREGDLYPRAPAEITAEPVPATASKATVPSAKVAAPPAAPAKQTEMIPPTTAPVPKPETKDDPIQRLRALNAQAFAMAVQVLKDPTKRIAFSAQRIQLEKDFNGIVSQLAPSIYADQAKAIFEAFLDFRYVEQEGPVVSLRLNKMKN